MPSIYEPIDTNRYEIRILRLDPAPDDGIISGTLIKVSLLGTPTYHALSYCWGDESATTNAIFNDIDVSITVSLDSALRYCRRHGIDRVWADAICINQSDLTEKSLQVRNMKQIYYHATKTIAWLGDRQDDGAELSLKFLNLVRSGHAVVSANASISHSPQCRLVLDGEESNGNENENGDLPLHAISDPASRATDATDRCLLCVTARFFRGLVDLFERPYWKRRWIIQEMAVSLRVDVVCGDTTISMGSLEEALSICRQSSYWQALNKASSSHYATLMDLQRHYLRKSIFMSDAIAATSDFLSKDPLDVIFAVVGIAFDGAALVPLPSYQVSPDQLAVTFTRALLREYGCFDIIWNHQEPTAERSSALPSWAPDWFSGAYPHRDFAPTELSQFLSVPYRLQSLEGQLGVLRLQGTVLGTVTRMSLSLRDQPGGSFDFEDFAASYKVSTYYRNSDLREAIFNCAFPTSPAAQSVYVGSQPLELWHALWKRPWLDVLKDMFDFTKHPGSRIIWLRYCLRVLLDASESADTHRKTDGIRSRLEQWLRANQGFRLGGVPIEKRLLVPQRSATSSHLKNWCQRLMGFLAGLGMLAYVFCSASDLIGLYVLYILLLGSVFLMLFMLGWIKSDQTVAQYLNENKDYMERWAWESKRFIVTDRGMIAASSFAVRSGDEICLLAGCTSATILRRISHTNTNYRVVGQAYVCLSVEDHKRLGACLVGAGAVAGEDLDAESVPYNAAITRYQSKPWWQEFIVV